MSENNVSNDIIPTRAVVIYHDNCVDGFASAWAFKKLAESDYKDGVIYVPAQYNQDPPIFAEPQNTDLFILDFSFRRVTIETYATLFASVTVLDHHKTATEDLSGWDHGFSNLEIVFDMNRSGAGISWDYFADPSEPRPALIDYVEDRDIWKWEVPDSAEINSLIGFTKKEFSAYDRLEELLEHNHYAAVGMGSLLLEQQERHVQSIIKSTKRPIEINGRHGLICNCPGQFASDVGSELAKESGTFGATCYQGSDEKIHFSLRSIGDYDVSEIAKDFGGGGHKNAAGFVMDIISENPGGSGVTLYNTGLGDLEEMTDDNT